ncbi:MAG: 2'-5' RNA ligase family protein [Pseudorhodoplanes sp.]
MSPALAGGPIIVTATFGDGDNGWLQQMRRDHFPAGRNQVPAHLTLFHHLPPDVAPELARRLAAATTAPAPPARIVEVIELGGGTALRVESESLAAIREDLADALHGLMTPQDKAAWRPHVTIQNKVEPKEAKALQQRLRATFEPRPLAIRGLASWHYRGGPWEPIREHVFRR